MCIYESVLLTIDSMSSSRQIFQFYFKMSHQWTAIVALFFLSAVASESCEYEKFINETDTKHAACKPRNDTCGIVNDAVTDEDKTLILQLHNQYRNYIAKRRIKPSVSNMRELEWDDELAHVAQKHAETCNPEYDCAECRRVDRFGIVGQIIYEASSADFPNVWEEMMKDFRESPKYYPHSNQLRWAETWAIGCGKVETEDSGERKALVVCNYGPGAIGNFASFKNGEPCSNCPWGTCCGHYCSDAEASPSPYPALCRKVPCKYEKFTPEHIACQEMTPECQVSNNKVTEGEKLLVLELLNRHREEVVFGRSSFNDNTLPSASDMRQMEWDEELALLAQRQAQLCKTEKICPECRKVDRFDVGQIVYVSSNTKFPRVWENMVDSYLENCEHFNQIISASTWRVGCGKAITMSASFTDFKTLIVCNFGPDAYSTYLCDDGLPYEAGDRCSNCPENTCCGDSCADIQVLRTNFNGLCKSTMEEDLRRCKYEKFHPDHVGCKQGSPNCTLLDVGLREYEEEMILKLHNDYRENTAMGRDTTEEQGATNMRQMVWDNELAYLAQRHAFTCNPNPYCDDCRKVDRFDYVGQIIYESYADLSEFKSELEKMLNPDELNEEQLIQLRFADTWRIGCGRVVYRDLFQKKMIIICNYGPGAKNIAEENIYNRGDPCTECPTGTCCGKLCEPFGVLADYEGLCKSNLVDTPGFNIEPNSCRYRKFSFEHAGCKPRDLTCKILTNYVPEHHKNHVLYHHNLYRDMIANNSTSLAIPAANMREIEWDDELAMLAQRHAETCNKKKDCYECRRVDRFNVNQLIYTYETNENISGNDWLEMMTAFMRDRDGFPQIVRADTWRLGCGRVVFEEGSHNQSLIVCNYGPDVNPERRETEVLPFKVGPACSACPSGTCCYKQCRDLGIEAKNPGLCKSKSGRTWVPDKESTTFEEDLGRCEYKKFHPDHVGCKSSDFQCNVWNRGINEYEKHVILKLHNDYRDNIAMGRETTEEQEATNMRQMVWDNELAYLAQKHADTCNANPYCDDCRKVDRFDYVGQIIYESYQDVTDFYSELEKMLNPNVLNEEQANQLRFADTWRVGCGKVIYVQLGKNKMIIICNYGPGAKPGEITKANTYNPGETCSECPEGTCCGILCKQFGISANYEGLCRLNLVDTPGFDIELENCKYKNFTFQHVGCKPRNLTCKILNNYVSYNDAVMILDLHNKYRNDIARGKINVIPDIDQGASDMWEMVWDRELAELAQRHAETCNKKKACFYCKTTDRFNINELIYTSNTSDFPGEWENMFEAFKSNSLEQIARNDSWRIGCGKVEFEEGSHIQTMIVCNYGPYVRRSWKKIKVLPFTLGPKCIACPSETCCGAACNETRVQTKYEALCKSTSVNEWEPDEESTSGREYEFIDGIEPDD